MTHWT